MKAGKIICEGRVPGGKKGTTCGMHTTDLVIKHAVGLVVRTEHKKVVDHFSEFNELRKKIHGLLSRIMDKKAKKRFDELNEQSIAIFKCKALRLEIPNTTRVAGIHRMLESVLRSKHLLSIFQGSCSFREQLASVKISDDDWVVIAECEAILRHLNVLAMESQRDGDGSIAFSWFQTACCRSRLEREKEFLVVDCSKNWTTESSFADIPKMKLKEENLSKIPLTMLHRLQKEFQQYLPEPDEDQILAMVLHPVMATQGFQ